MITTGSYVAVLGDFDFTIPDPSAARGVDGDRDVVGVSLSDRAEDVHGDLGDDVLEKALHVARREGLGLRVGADAHLCSSRASADAATPQLRRGAQIREGAWPGRRPAHTCSSDKVVHCTMLCAHQKRAHDFPANGSSVSSCCVP